MYIMMYTIATAGPRSGALVQQLIHKMLVDLTREEVKAIASQGDAREMPIEAVVQFVAGGLFGLLMWWGNGKMRLSVEDVNTRFRRLAIPALKVALT
jgi:glucose uptake protein GlcU